MGAAKDSAPGPSSSVMTVAEVCELLNIHRSTVYRLIKSGAIPFFHVGSDYRFNRNRIDRWRFSQQAKPKT